MEGSAWGGVTRVGKYQLLRELGRGGMGVVYLAEDTRLQRQVALKVLHPFLSMDEDFVQRFASEARAIAALAHPGIVRIHAFEEVDGGHLIDMEYIEGGSLDVHVRQGRLNAVQGLGIALRVFEALAACHARGIIHRDIKPSNILLSDDGRVLLSDFGLARSCAVAAASTSTSSSFIGTPKYAAPETWDKGHATPAGDVYSAGLVLLELLAGRTPYDGDSPMTIMRKVMAGARTSARHYLPEASDALVDLIDAALSENPLDRPENGGAALVRLRAAPETAALPDERLETLRITPVRVNRPRRAPEKGRRLLVAAGLAGVVALVGWLAYMEIPVSPGAPVRPETAPAETPAVPVASPEVNNVFLAGDRVVFAATANGRRSLWTFDPSGGAMEPLWPDLKLEPEDDLQGFLPVHRGIVAVIRSPVNGFTLFRTDGTPGGTFSLAHAASWSASRIALFTAHEGTAYFCRFGGDNTYGVWKTDGSVEGTRHVWGGIHEAIVTGMATTPTGGLYTSGGPSGHVYYFAPGQNTPVFLGHAPHFAIFAERMITLGERVLVESDDAKGAGRELWVGGKTAEEFKLLRDFMPGGAPGVLEVDFGRYRDLVVFTASTPEHGREPWLTDGTTEGTRLLCDVNPGVADSIPLRFVESGGLLYFNAEHAKYGKELWISDGTPEGTRLTRDVAEGWRSANPHSIRPFKGGVLFTADDLIHGEELWFSDGTEAGTRLVLDCMPGGEGRGAFGLEVAGERAFFAAAHPEFGRVLWETDGTAEGMRPLFERLEAQPVAPAEPAPWVARSNLEPIITMATPEHGAEPWVVSHARAEAILIRDIRPGPEGSDPSDYVEVLGSVYFAADDGIVGRELWVTGGDRQFTKVAYDGWKGPGSGNPRELTFWPPNRLAYVTFNGTEDEIACLVEGQWTEIRISKPDHILSTWKPRDLQVLNEQWLYFSNQTASGETALWRTDGTKVERVPGLGRAKPPQ